MATQYRSVQIIHRLYPREPHYLHGKRPVMAAAALSFLTGVLTGRQHRSTGIVRKLPVVKHLGGKCEPDTTQTVTVPAGHSKTTKGMPAPFVKSQFNFEGQ